jgi:hypothetical protein
MSADHCDRYSITRAGQLLDSEPMKADKDILTFRNGKWKPWKGTIGEWKDSIPVTAKEAAQFCKDGSKSKHVNKAIADDTGYYPDPDDDQARNVYENR